MHARQDPSTWPCFTLTAQISSHSVLTSHSFLLQTVIQNAIAASVSMVVTVNTGIEAMIDMRTGTGTGIAMNQDVIPSAKGEIEIESVMDMVTGTETVIAMRLEEAGAIMKSMVDDDMMMIGVGIIVGQGTKSSAEAFAADDLTEMRRIEAEDGIRRKRALLNVARQRLLMPRLCPCGNARRVDGTCTPLDTNNIPQCRLSRQVG